MHLSSGIVFDPSPSTGAWIQGLVVLARRRAQLHSLRFCERFSEISATWQYQVLGGIRAFCHSFSAWAIVVSRRVCTTHRPNPYALVVSGGNQEKKQVRARSSDN
jgi:hypothetical protein